MDCVKIGQLILQLRTEKGLTQRQVAQKLNISNKTVSKWECGLGCPDVTLWDELSTVLGADILPLLQGELNLNRPDVGKIKQVRFYVCPICGNILISTGDAAIACCGRKLSPLTPALCSPEHRVTVEEMDMEYCLTLEHDMTKEHHISFVAYVHLDRVLLYRLYPEQTPVVRIPIMKRGGDLYLYCVKHGLQKYPMTL